MDYFDTLTQQRIDSDTADLVDRLLRQYTPALTPCRTLPHEIWNRLQQTYPLSVLPPDNLHYMRTALAVIDTCFPEDAAYLSCDPEVRLHAACALSHTLHLDIRCAEMRDEDAGHTLYVSQQAQFEQRTAGCGLIWTHMPVRICMECSTGYTLITGSDLLTDQVTLWRGVSQSDIDGRTPELIAYLRAKYNAKDG